MARANDIDGESHPPMSRRNGGYAIPNDRAARKANDEHGNGDRDRPARVRGVQRADARLGTD